MCHPGSGSSGAAAMVLTDATARQAAGPLISKARHFAGCSAHVAACAGWGHIARRAGGDVDTLGDCRVAQLAEGCGAVLCAQARVRTGLRAGTGSKGLGWVQGVRA